MTSDCQQEVGICLVIRLMKTGEWWRMEIHVFEWQWGKLKAKEQSDKLSICRLRFFNLCGGLLTWIEWSFQCKCFQVVFFPEEDFRTKASERFQIFLQLKLILQLKVSDQTASCNGGSPWSFRKPLAVTISKEKLPELRSFQWTLKKNWDTTYTPFPNISFAHISIYLIRVFQQCTSKITIRTIAQRSPSMSPIQTQLVLSFLYRIQVFRASMLQWSNGENPHCNPCRDIAKTLRKYLNILWTL